MSNPLQRHTLMIYIISPNLAIPRPKPSPRADFWDLASRAYTFQQSSSTLGSRAWHEARLWRQHDLIIEVLSMKFLWYQVSALGGPPGGDENWSFPSRVLIQQHIIGSYIYLFFCLSLLVLSLASHFGSESQVKIKAGRFTIGTELAAFLLLGI